MSNKTDREQYYIEHRDEILKKLKDRRDKDKQRQPEELKRKEREKREKHRERIEAYANFVKEQRTQASVKKHREMKANAIKHKGGECIFCGLQYDGWNACFHHLDLCSHFFQLLGCVFQL